MLQKNYVKVNENACGKFESLCVCVCFRWRERESERERERERSQSLPNIWVYDNACLEWEGSMPECGLEWDLRE